MPFEKCPGSAANYVFVRLSARFFLLETQTLGRTLTLVSRVNIEPIGTKVVNKNHRGGFLGGGKFKVQRE